MRIVPSKTGASSTAGALDSRHQPDIDELFTHVRNHADVSGFLNHRNPLNPMLVSSHHEQERRLDEHVEPERGCSLRNCPAVLDNRAK